MRLNAIFLGMMLLGGASLPAGADPPRFHCRPDEWKGVRASLWSADPASIDLYNGALWSVTAGIVSATASPPGDPRWSERNGFDDAFRSAFKLGSDSGRSAAASASDGLWAVSMAAPLLVDGLVTWSEGHCDQAFHVATHWMESMSLTALLVTSTKDVAARKRPGSGDRGSFFSGHAALSATGAGLLCRDSVKNQIWGTGTLDQAVPCGLGVAAALATGMLRVAADKHWMSDVLVAWTVGGLIGWFDLPGPFDLLRFRVRGHDGGTRAVGFVAPYSEDDAVGARLSMQFY